MEKKELGEDIEQQYFESVPTPSAEMDEGTRDMVLYPFVISGGKNTEHFYFKHISEKTDYKFIIKPEFFGDESNYTEVFPKRITEILNKNNDAQIFCVFDWDTTYGRKKQLEKHEAFVNQFKTEIDTGIVTVCPSMPSIEYWFLLHFENRTQLIKTCGRTMQNLLTPYMSPLFPDTNGKKLLSVLKGEEYVKDSGWVVKLCENGKLADAIQRAENNIKAAEATGDLEKQSYSFVYLLFKNREGE